MNYQGIREEVKRMSRDDMLTLAYDMVNKYVRGFRGKGKYRNLNDDDDELVHTVYEVLLRRDFFTKFNPSTTSFEYWIKTGVSRCLIDLTRTKAHRTEPFDHFEDPVYHGEDGETVTRAEVFADRTAFNPETDIFPEELHMDIRNVTLSEKPLTSRTEVLRSDKGMVEMLMDGQSFVQIAETWGVSVATINRQADKMIAKA